MIELFPQKKKNVQPAVGYLGLNCKSESPSKRTQCNTTNCARQR